MNNSTLSCLILALLMNILTHGAKAPGEVLCLLPPSPLSCTPCKTHTQPKPLLQRGIWLGMRGELTVAYSAPTMACGA